RPPTIYPCTRSVTESIRASAPLPDPSAAQTLDEADDVTRAIGELGVELRDLLDRRVLVDRILQIGHGHAEELQQPARLVAGPAPSVLPMVGPRQAGPSPLGSRASSFNPMVGPRRADLMFARLRARGPSPTRPAARTAARSGRGPPPSVEGQLGDVTPAR